MSVCEYRSASMAEEGHRDDDVIIETLRRVWSNEHHGDSGQEQAAQEEDGRLASSLAALVASGAGRSAQRAVDLAMSSNPTEKPGLAAGFEFDKFCRAERAKASAGDVM